MTPEAMLQAIIERQCAGGYDRWHRKLYPNREKTKEFHTSWTLNSELRSKELLMVLLDPSGLKSAYGDYPCNTAIGHFEDGGDFRIQKVIPQWTTNAHKILDTWLETSSPEKTIETAYSLLPTV